MRNVRKLLLFAAMALAATVVSAPAAFGQIQENHETLEIRNALTNEHCPAVNMATHTGGCVIHAKSEGEVELRKHVFGIESHITKCEYEGWGHTNEDAEGWIYHQQLIGHGGGCQRQACTENGVKHEWPAHADEAHKATVPKAGETNAPIVAGHRETVTVVFCVEPAGGGADETCEIDIPFNQIGVTTTYEGGDVAELAGHGVGGFRCEVIGHWTTEHIPVGNGGHVENNPLLPKENEVLITHLAAENKPEVP
jgi:hypothetical protein